MSLPVNADEIKGAWFAANSKIFQWTEKKSCEEKKTSGGAREKHCQWDYVREWVSKPVDSNTFHCYPTKQSGCTSKWAKTIENTGTIPSELQFRFAGKHIGIGTATSAYYLSKDTYGIFQSKAVPISDISKTKSPPALKGKTPTRGAVGVIKYVAKPGVDAIGDVETTFTQSDIRVFETEVSAIALTRRHGSSKNAVDLIPWNTKLPGTMSTVNWAFLGRLTKGEIIEKKHSDNDAMVMILRLVGVVLMFLGLQLFTGPISLMPSIIPCCGEALSDIIGCALCCLNSLIAMSLSILVIAIAWLLARPLFGIMLLAVAAGFMAAARYFFNVGGKKGARAPHIQDPEAGQELQRPFGEIPMATPVKAALNFAVVCPEGVGPGQTVQVTAPDGTVCMVQVPPGCEPGQTFMVQK
eukprot:TRINITY_DN25764_c0_g1_i1.p1 TRINITY_DN25764_c0_g1~~TRINITY_DN25764_c0_g1_i1.p1  ORF type:complete len:471 (-),score=60.20 TRINITY_DN25764_c0_g1_i1:62-1294(-)